MLHSEAAIALKRHEQNILSIHFFITEYGKDFMLASTLFYGFSIETKKYTVRIQHCKSYIMGKRCFHRFYWSPFYTWYDNEVLYEVEF